MKMHNGFSVLQQSNCQTQYCWRKLKERSVPSVTYHSGHSARNGQHGPDKKTKRTLSTPEVNLDCTFKDKCSKFTILVARDRKM